MPRLPIPGQDSGKWGDVLNDYLRAVHDEQGQLKPSVVKAPQLSHGSVTGVALADGVVSSSKIAAGAVSDDKLTSTLRDRIETLETVTGGRSIEIRANTTHVQWKYSEDGVWTDLVALDSLRGELGPQGVQGIKGDKGDKGDPGSTDYNELINTPDLNLKADKATNYTKTEVDTALNTKQPTGDYATNSSLTAHTSNTANPHNTTKSQVGLPDVPNLDTTAAVANQHTHANKPVLDSTTASFTTADEMKLDGIATGAQVNTVTSVAGKTGAVTLAKGDVGLGNVDDTSDMNKPVSTAQAAADATKVSLTGNQTIAGTKTFSSALITQSGTSIGGVLHLTGVGFPDGVVSAPVGSIYIDKAVTNGVSSWIKKSSTGNTGWTVMVGDTGRRRYDALITVPNSGSARVYLRRTNDTVSVDVDSFHLDNPVGNHSTFAVLPSGFAPTTPLRAWAYEIGSIYMSSSGPNGEYLEIRSREPIPASRQSRFNITFITQSPWPTTLPGTAA